MSSSDFNSLIISFQSKFSIKSHLLLVTWFVMDIVSSPVFSVPNRLHAWILVMCVQFRHVVFCPTLVLCVPYCVYQACVTNILNC